MKKITKNILIFGLILSMLALCACHETPVTPDEPDGPITLNVEDFVIFEDFAEKVKADFADENRTNNAYYDTDGDGLRDTQLTDTAYPSRRFFMIKSQSEYDQIFTDLIDPTPIDFDKEIYILYIFTAYSNYSGTFFAIDNACLINGTLEIDANLKLCDENFDLVGCTPLQRFALIRMDKIDAENIVLK